MAMSKNGLGHRPFGEWALDEDDLEKLGKEGMEQNEEMQKSKNPYTLTHTSTAGSSTIGSSTPTLPHLT